MKTAAMFVWLAALYGILSVADAPAGEGSHFVCGPTLPALVACHGFWTLMIVPLALVLLWNRSPNLMQRFGIACMVVGMIGLVGVAAWQVLVWWPAASQWERPYLVQRFLFCVATLVDVPMVQMIFLGMTCWTAGRIRRHEAEGRPSSPDADLGR